MREGCDKAHFIPRHYVQRQRMVYHRLFGQDEARLGKRFLRQTGSIRHGQSKNSRLIGKHGRRSCLDSGPCGSGHNYRPLDEQHKFLRDRHIRSEFLILVKQLA